MLRHRPVSSNSPIEHPTECDTIDHSRLHAEPNDTASVMIQDYQDPVSLQGGRFTPEQTDTPETVLQMSNEGQPGWSTGVLFRSIVAGKDRSNNVFVDWDGESPGNLRGNSWATQVGLRCFVWTTASMSCWLGLFRAGLGVKRQGYTFRNRSLWRLADLVVPANRERSESETRLTFAAQ